MESENYNTSFRIPIDYAVAGGELTAFSAEGKLTAHAAREVSDFRRCSACLGQLVALGMKPEIAPAQDDLYWDLVHAKRNTRWDQEYPGKDGIFAGVDLDKAGKAIEDMSGEGSSFLDGVGVLDVYFELLYKLTTETRPPESVIPIKISLADFVRMAVWVVTAEHFGVYNSRRRALVELFWKARSDHF